MNLVPTVISIRLKLYLTDRTVTLDRVRSASGAKYKNSDLMFWNKGDRALLEITGTTYRCQRNLQREPRIERGRRAVDFRATGNEPGWLLEIDRHFIRILSDYGNNLVTTPVPSIQSVAGASVYEAQTEAHSLRIVIQTPIL